MGSLQTAEIARSKRGDVRLDYLSREGHAIVLWERLKENVLETRFKGDGSIILQRLLPKDSNIDQYCAALITQSGLPGAKDVEYRKVALERECPSCSKRSLERYVEAYRSNEEVPVMPIYHCRECRGKSYLLTDEYLHYLVTSNPELFGTKEIAEMREDKDRFMGELRRYIISIFASKKIKSIS